MVGVGVGMNVDPTLPQKWEIPLSKHLTQNGADVVFNANGNFSALEATWELRPPAGEIYTVTNMIIQIRVTNNLSSEPYADPSTTLTEGIKVARIRGIRDPLNTEEILTDQRIFNAEDWNRYTGQPSSIATYGVAAADDYATFNWCFRDQGISLRLNGDQLEALRITLNDDFSALVQHHFVAKGHRFLGHQILADNPF